MATTSDGIWTPDDPDDWDLTVDWAANANSIQVVFDRRANAYKGTASQRAAFSTAPEGVLWKDTDGTKGLYARESGAWVGVISDTGWVNFTPVTPWVIDATYPPAYRVKNGVVFFRGRVSGALTTSTIFNLPATARPSMLSFFTLDRGSASSLSRVTVDSTGAMVHSSTTATAAGNGLALAGMTFPLG